MRNIRVSWVADMLEYTRSNMYNILSRETMDIELLAKISSVVRYDFVTEYAREAGLQEYECKKVLNR